MIPEETPQPQPPTEQDATSLPTLLLRAAFQLLITFGLWGSMLLASAGTTTWPRGWLHIALWVLTFLVNLSVLLRLNRDVLVARLTRRRSQQREDTVILLLFLVAILAIPIVAGLDTVRYHWLPLPFWTVYPAILLHVAGNVLLLWTMVVNPFLEKVVRIQTDRSHRVITTGPYAIVRHPMYLAITAMFLAIPLTLGSGWTFVPTLALILLLVVRTQSEEQLLRQHLPGYEDYMTKTRFRILPGIW